MKISSNIENLQQVRDYIRKFCSALASPLPDEKLDMLELAANEVAANIIRHGYDDKKPGTFEIIILRESNGILIQFLDQGHPFNREDATLFNPETDNIIDKTGGFGLFIIEKIMDRVTYDQDDLGNNRTRLFLKI
ncbi:serine/threonine-protein kinase RsbW/sigma-B regulation protein RsbU (phosphoserine phosphatase) [Desulfocicer vacuolatum DSM 3385]|uniref:Serine/threonine-protein kinase RsbW/sigma-B regulation protein RsbU (Phosphoserine phosphatase) n=1 Tax=Desulfocicer vacuolatum DSM 3385 TaxID=1121400 RepID=A0A1W2DNN8_9BACT|nr:ATP-binding protein [Desulfocicer vacuolatum]SMC99037.1 serine/threonine-protein kinase RsbW/sigma-B regulation protein RsbU (phosphoserine phosphatase) [Desulfocicer vacuolatum DSM 3385]